MVQPLRGRPSRKHQTSQTRPDQTRPDQTRPDQTRAAAGRLHTAAPARAWLGSAPLARVDTIGYQSLLWLVIGRREPRAGAGGAGAQPDIHSLDSDPTQTSLDSQT